MAYMPKAQAPSYKSLVGTGRNLSQQAEHLIEYNMHQLGNNIELIQSTVHGAFDGVGSKLKTGLVPLLGEDVVLDDEDATFVFVFPRAAELGGPVQRLQVVEDPYARAERIFIRLHNHSSKETMVKGFERFTRPVSMEVYQADIRMKFLEVLVSAGLKVSDFESIDGDEVFLKVSLNRSGTVIKQLAERMSYNMPVKPEAYKILEPFGIYPGGKPMENDDGEVVPAYMPFTMEMESVFGPFREVDEIRILRSFFADWIDLGEMKHQQVIETYFVSSDFESIIALSQDFASLRNIWKLPGNTQRGLLRNYFGERIAFVFRWQSFYTQSLVPLAIIGGGYFIAVKFVHVNPNNLKYFQIAMAVVLAVWAAVFGQLFNLRTSRTKQLWGMQNFQEEADQRSEWNPNLRDFGRATLVNSIVAASVIGFFSFIVWFIMLGKNHAIAKNPTNKTLHTLGLSIIIKAGGFLWSKIAPRIVDIMNFRMQDRYDNCLVWVVASFKIIVTLWPLIVTCFIQKFAMSVCDVSFEEGIKDVYPAYPLSAWNQTDVDKFKKYFTFTGENPAQSMCIYGCYPAEPFGVSSHSTTICQADAESFLNTFFLYGMISDIVFLLLPIFLTKWAVMEEIQSVKEASTGDEHAKQYTMLQFQAKCSKQAPYEYQSWGGSSLEDFLNMTIGYALVVCFGIISPVICVAALINGFITYRLLAYRMTHVTGRPFPSGAAGIGKWADILAVINVLAVVCNVGLITFFLYPARSYRRHLQLLLFLVLEHAIMILRAGIDMVIPDTAADVVAVEDFNNNFKLRLSATVPLKVPSEEICKSNGIDLNLVPSNIELVYEDSD